MKDFAYINFLGDNDISFSVAEVDGVDIKTIEGPERVRQDLAKAVMTPSGLLPYPKYGTDLPYLVNTRFTGPSLYNTIADSIELCVRYLASIEESTSDDELISEISKLEISFTSGELKTDLVVKTKSGDEAGLRTII